MEMINKKAYFKYEVIDKYIAGIKLIGSEIKSVVDNKINFTDSYCFFVENELFLKNFHIASYDKNCTFTEHEPKRDKKLLLTRKELNKLFEKVSEKGLTIMPLKIFTNDKGKAKMEIALCKGKKEYDKREALKERDFKRQKLEL